MAPCYSVVWLNMITNVYLLSNNDNIYIDNVVFVYFVGFLWGLNAFGRVMGSEGLALVERLVLSSRVLIRQVNIV